MRITEAVALSGLGRASHYTRLFKGMTVQTNDGEGDLLRVIKHKQKSPCQGGYRSAFKVVVRLNDGRIRRYSISECRSKN